MSLLNYFLLSDVHKNIKVKAVALKGRSLPLALGLTSHSPSYSPLTAPTAGVAGAAGTTASDGSLSLTAYHSLALPNECEIFIEAAIFSDGQRIGTSSFTTYRRSSSLSPSSIPSSLPAASSSSAPHTGRELDQLRFSEWLTFPVKYPDLLPTSRLVFTVWAVSHPSSTTADVSTSSAPFPLGGTSLPLFNKRGVLKLGRRRLVLHLGVPGDGAPQSSTPHKVGPEEGVGRLEHLIWQYDQKELPCDVKWLDKLALHRIAALQMRESAQLPPLASLAAMSVLGSAPTVPPSLPASSSAARSIHLIVEFPSFPHPLVYSEKNCNPAPPPLLPVGDPTRVFVCHDPELARENPVEQKYHKLSRSVKGLSDRDLKPRIAERRALDRIISSPVPRLTMDEKELLWKFRFSLLDDRRALTKFLRAVDWSDVGETAEAVSLLQRWTAVDIAAALEMLSSSFTNEDVRAYAVKQLARADNDEISAYLLQLVQALRYETNYPSPLSTFLIERCTASMQLSNFLYWYGTHQYNNQACNVCRCLLAGETWHSSDAAPRHLHTHLSVTFCTVCFCRYVRVEERDVRQGKRYAELLSDFLKQLETSTSGDRRSWHASLHLEAELMDHLRELNERVLQHKKVEKKIERLRAMLAEGGSSKHLRRFADAIRMAVKPEMLLTGLVGEESTLFRSALAPMLLCFTTADGGRYRVMYKRGDDLRQDQLMIQMINLMDSLLKKVRLDLQLTPYRVLATSTIDGFVEYIPKCSTVASILAQYEGDLRKYLHKHNPTAEGMAKAVERFIKSCAGYAVITYILGIGDRHLDNIMLQESGQLFHIDFGFIFGRDPKPFPPPIKITKEMIEAMGGYDHEHYAAFRQYAVSAFNILRQHAALILNLLSLMADAGIAGVSNEIDKNLLSTQKNFMLEKTDEEAGGTILALIDQSVSALFPVMMERIHKCQYAQHSTAQLSTAQHTPTRTRTCLPLRRTHC